MAEMDNEIKEATMQEHETFQARISTLDLCIIYSLMVKRIAKGYSTAEVSFLMGYEKDTIRDLERLDFKELMFDEVHGYTRVLEDEDLNAIIMGNGDNRFANYQVVRTTESALIHHEVFEIMPDKTLRQFFHLLEANPEHNKLRYSSSYQMGIMEAKETIQLLLTGALLQSPQTPLEIYGRCRRLSDNAGMQPYYVQAALNEMIQSKEYPKLKRIKAKKRGCLYAKAF